MATEDWIQESLARLESLEEERNRHEAALETANDSTELRMHTQAIERLEAKIRSLYAELEAAAEQGDGADAGEDEDEDETDFGDSGQGQQAAASDVETRLFRREDVAAQAAAVTTAASASAASAAVQAAPVQPQPVSTPTASPFGGSAPVSTPTASPFGGSAPVSTASPFGGSAPVSTASPFGGSAPESSPFGDAPPSASPFGGGASASPFGGSAAAASFNASSSGGGYPTAPASSFSGSGASLDDDDGRRSGAPWALIIGLIVLVGGVGGYFALRPKEEPPAVAPMEPAKLIKGIEIPPDTQGPKVIKGSDVDSVKGSQFKEGRPHSGGGGGGGGSSTPTTSDKPKKKDPKTTIVSTDDPLAGIN